MVRCRMCQATSKGVGGFPNYPHAHQYIEISSVAGGIPAPGHVLIDVTRGF